MVADANVRGDSAMEKKEKRKKEEKTENRKKRIFSPLLC